jgi:hypothetical protein
MWMSLVLWIWWSSLARQIWIRSGRYVRMVMMVSLTQGKQQNKTDIWIDSRWQFLDTVVQYGTAVLVFDGAPVDARCSVSSTWPRFRKLARMLQANDMNHFREVFDVYVLKVGNSGWHDWNLEGFGRLTRSMMGVWHDLTWQQIINSFDVHMMMFIRVPRFYP